MKDLKRKVWVLILSFCTLLLVLTFILKPFTKKGDQRITIGAKNCTEQVVLAEILACLIEDQTEIKVVRRYNLEGTAICFQSLLSGDVDVYFEYTGTALIDILKERAVPADLYTYLKKSFEKKFGLIWLDRLGFSNHYGLIVRSSSPYRKISDVVKIPKLSLAFDPEFTIRHDFELIKASYPIPEQWKPKMMDPVLLYFSLMNESVDVISGAVTQGRLVDTSFVILEDDCNSLPKYEVAPLTSKGCIERFPELFSVCELLSGKITEEEMRLLNHAVEFEGKNIQEAARDFLQTRGLLSS